VIGRDRFLDVELVELLIALSLIGIIIVRPFLGLRLVSRTREAVDGVSELVADVLHMARRFTAPVMAYFAALSGCGRCLNCRPCSTIGVSPKLTVDGAGGKIEWRLAAPPLLVASNRYLLDDTFGSVDEGSSFR